VFDDVYDPPQLPPGTIAVRIPTKEELMNLPPWRRRMAIASLNRSLRAALRSGNGGLLRRGEPVPEGVPVFSPMGTRKVKKD
jgi:hypothetical protein